MWPTSVVRRAVGVGRYCLIALAALAGATLISNLAEYRLDPATAPDGSAGSAEKSAARSMPGPRLNESVIFRRNLFGVDTGAEDVAQSPKLVARNVDLLLLGTAEVDNRGYAVFKNADSGEQDVFAVGERVFDGPKLVSVGQRQAVVMLKGRRITIEILEEDQGAAVAAPSASHMESPPGEIRKTGTGTYVVSRREVDHSIENLSYVITQARAVPVLRDGETVGFKIFNIRSRSLFDRLGLRNGDVVQQVNGMKLNDPSKAIGLLDELQSVDELKLNFLRGGKPVTFTYEIK